MSTASTRPARRKPSDRAPKGGSSHYAQQVTAVEETLRAEYTSGSTPVTRTEDDAAANRRLNTVMVGACALIVTLLVVGIALMGTMALAGQVNALSWLGLALVVTGCGLGLGVVSPTMQVAMREMLGRADGTQVHVLTAVSIGALREAPDVLREAEAPAGVIDAAVSLHGRGEARLAAIVTSEDPNAIDTDSVRALVRDAARSLALVAIHDQRPDLALKAAVEALAVPARRR